MAQRTAQLTANGVSQSVAAAIAALAPLTAAFDIVDLASTVGRDAAPVV